MAKCKACSGTGKNFTALRGGTADFLGCFTCDGTGTIQRTGPYRLADGTWSDGVDRSKRIWSTYFAMQNRRRWHVYKGWPDFYTGHEWRVYSDRGFLSYHKTQEQAIAYADRMARTNQGENNA